MQQAYIRSMRQKQLLEDCDEVVVGNKSANGEKQIVHAHKKKEELLRENNIANLVAANFNMV